MQSSYIVQQRARWRDVAKSFCHNSFLSQTDKQTNEQSHIYRGGARKKLWSPCVHSQEVSQASNWLKGRHSCQCCQSKNVLLLNNQRSEGKKLSKTHKHTQNKHVSRCCSTTKLAQYSDRNVYFIFLLYSILFNFLYLILSYFILFCFILCYIISFNLSYFIFFLHFILQFHGVVGTKKKNWNGHLVRYTVVFRVAPQLKRGFRIM